MTTAHVAATVPLPPPVARPQDAQLRQDVRWLAATLGRVVGRLAGEDTFRAVEELRRACRARRLGVPGAADLDTLLARTRSLPPETARLTARAFTVFFILINAAEQAHRVRRSRQDDLAAAQRGSVRWSLRRLREAGLGAEEITRALLTLDGRPVLTAHPPESPRSLWGAGSAVTGTATRSSPRRSRSLPRAAPAVRCSATTRGGWLTSPRGSPYPSGSPRSRPSCGPRSSATARRCRVCGSRTAAATPTSPSA